LLIPPSVIGELSLYLHKEGILEANKEIVEQEVIRAFVLKSNYMLHRVDKSTGLSFNAYSQNKFLA